MSTGEVRSSLPFEPPSVNSLGSTDSSKPSAISESGGTASNIIDSILTAIEAIFQKFLDALPKATKNDKEGTKDSCRPNKHDLNAEQQKEFDALKQRTFDEHTEQPYYSNLMVKVVSKWGLDLQFASKELQGRLDVVAAANRNHGGAAQFAAVSIKGDRNAVLKLVRENGHALGHVDKSFRDDEEVVLAAVSQTECAFTHYASDRLKAKTEELEFAQKLVAANPHTLGLLPRKYRDSEEFVGNLMKKEVSVLYYASDRIKQITAFSKAFLDAPNQFYRHEIFNYQLERIKKGEPTGWSIEALEASKSLSKSN